MSTKAPLLALLCCCSPPARERGAGVALPRAAPAGRADLLALSQRGCARQRRRVRDGDAPRRDRGRACRSPTSAPARAIIRCACRRWSGPRAACSPRTSCPATIRALGQRIQRERLDNVAIKLGQPNDPQLPAGSFDRVFMIHMYHEIARPSEFLWNLRAGAEERRPGHRRRRRPADRPPRHAAAPAASASSTRSATSSPASSGCPTANPISPSSRPAAPRPEPRRHPGLHALEPVRAGPARRKLRHSPPAKIRWSWRTDAERGGGLGEPAGRRDVGLARPRIAARMVVGDHQAGRVVVERRGEDRRASAGDLVRLGAGQLVDARSAAARASRWSTASFSPARVGEQRREQIGRIAGGDDGHVPLLPPRARRGGEPGPIRTPFWIGIRPPRAAIDWAHAALSRPPPAHPRRGRRAEGPDRRRHAFGVRPPDALRPRRRASRCSPPRSCICARS